MSVWSGETWWNVVKRLCQTVCQSVCQLCDALCIAFVVNPAVRLLIGAWDAWPGGCSRWHGIWQRQRFKTNLSGNKKTCWINMLICIYIYYIIYLIYIWYCIICIVNYMSYPICSRHLRRHDSSCVESSRVPGRDRGDSASSQGGGPSARLCQ